MIKAPQPQGHGTPPANPTLPTGEANPGASGPPPTPPTTGGLVVKPPGDEDTGSGGGTGVVAGQPPPPPGGDTGPGPGNFGQAMYPWLMPYGGQFTAPMSPYEQGALGDYSQFVQGGQGMNQAQDYLGNVLGGQYLDINTNPWLGQIQKGMQGIKDYQDAQNLARIQSSMAGGGSAFSGASLGAQSDYLRNSNNAFQQMMGQLMNENYGRERGMQAMAPGQLGDIARQYGAGYGQMSQMGGLPRQLQQQDLTAQYGDWLRQAKGMEESFRYPDQLTQQLLYGGGYRGPQTQDQYGSSIGDIFSGLAGQTDWGQVAGNVGGIVSDIFGGGGNQTFNDQATMDGVQLGYDAAPTGPQGYWDQNYYNQALTGAQNKAIADQEKQPNTTAAGLIAMLLQLLGGGKKGAKTGGGGGGGGGSPKGGGDMLGGLFQGAGKGSKTGYDPKTGAQKTMLSDKYMAALARANANTRSTGKQAVIPGMTFNPEKGIYEWDSPTGSLEDFLAEQFGGNPASEYGAGMYDNPEESWQNMMDEAFGGGGGGDFGGYDPSNFGGGGFEGGGDFMDFGEGGGFFPGADEQSFDFGDFGGFGGGGGDYAGSDFGGGDFGAIGNGGGDAGWVEYV